ncbi:hypothetical protein D0Z00_000498 [Geotrichum galactomycetum]|uniref:Uncharacterized protein n=1 Tax=Geotrichum galactomycetum TaxID=27317 RepID=A0ACB6V9Y6_9ASCO|nr:hypothetical protein D0Z00_000498 [Geotrichum candidum]
MQLKSTVPFLSLFSYAAAHGYVSDISVGDNWYPGSNPFQDAWKNPVPERVVWSFFDGGNSPVADFTTKDIVCNTNAQAAKLYIDSIEAGSQITFYWTSWPSAHLGPIMTYLAKCNGDCRDNDPSSLSYFKIAEKGWENGKWATQELIANNNSWTVTLPSDIAAGNYLIRHELLALQEGARKLGAQFYPMCVNLKITGGGSANPEGVTFPGAYKTDDPGILIDIFNGITNYVIPGPAVYNSGSSSSQDRVESTTNKDEPAGVETSVSTASSKQISTALTTSTFSSSASPSSSPVLSSFKPAATSNTQKLLTSMSATVTKTAVATEVYESRGNGELVSVSIDSKDLPTRSAAAAPASSTDEDGVDVVIVTYFATTTTYVTRAPSTIAVTVFNENVVTQVVVQTKWAQNTPVTVYARAAAAATALAEAENEAATVTKSNYGTSSGSKSSRDVKSYLEKVKDVFKRML